VIGLLVLPALAGEPDLTIAWTESSSTDFAVFAIEKANVTFERLGVDVRRCEDQPQLQGHVRTALIDAGYTRGGVAPTSFGIIAETIRDKECLAGKSNPGIASVDVIDTDSGYEATVIVWSGTRRGMGQASAAKAGGGLGSAICTATTSALQDLGYGVDDATATLACSTQPVLNSATIAACERLATTVGAAGSWFDRDTTWRAEASIARCRVADALAAYAELVTDGDERALAELLLLLAELELWPHVVELATTWQQASRAPLARVIAAAFADRATHCLDGPCPSLTALSLSLDPTPRFATKLAWQHAAAASRCSATKGAATFGAILVSAAKTHGRTDDLDLALREIPLEDVLPDPWESWRRLSRPSVATRTASWDSLDPVDMLSVASWESLTSVVASRMATVLRCDTLPEPAAYDGADQPYFVLPQSGLTTVDIGRTQGSMTRVPLPRGIPVSMRGLDADWSRWYPLGIQSVRAEMQPDRVEGGVATEEPESEDKPPKGTLPEGVLPEANRRPLDLQVLEGATGAVRIALVPPRGTVEVHLPGEAAPVELELGERRWWTLGNALALLSGSELFLLGLPADPDPDPGDDTDHIEDKDDTPGLDPDDDSDEPDDTDNADDTDDTLDLDTIDIWIQAPEVGYSERISTHVEASLLVLESTGWGVVEERIRDEERRAKDQVRALFFNAHEVTLGGVASSCGPAPLRCPSQSLEAQLNVEVGLTPTLPGPVALFAQLTGTAGWSRARYPEIRDWVHACMIDPGRCPAAESWSADVASAVDAAKRRRIWLSAHQLTVEGGFGLRAGYLGFDRWSGALGITWAMSWPEQLQAQGTSVGTPDVLGLTPLVSRPQLLGGWARLEYRYGYVRLGGKFRFQNAFPEGYGTRTSLEGYIGPRTNPVDVMAPAPATRLLAGATLAVGAILDTLPAYQLDLTIYCAVHLDAGLLVRRMKEPP
jgi:hypothetical protein